MSATAQQSPQLQPGNTAEDFFDQPPRLAEWLDGAATELREVRKHFKPKHVHDLRVALRHCRTVAMAFEDLDPCGDWAQVKKSAKRTLESLNGARDNQVMREWVQKLRMEQSEAGKRLCAKLDEEERPALRMAEKGLKAADAKQWRKWGTELPERAEHVTAGSPAAELIALVSWQEAWDRHRAALQKRSGIAYHRLRVATKNFRYTLESFLPGRDARWKKLLKNLQDLLGEVHDLDVLWSAILHLHPKLEAAERAKWRGIIQAERNRRIADYRAKTKGAKSCWTKWRAALPEGKSLERARLAWLAAWASYLDPDPAHSMRVSRLAVELFDGLVHLAVPVLLPLRARDLLEAAAISHDVGRAKGEKRHQKASYKLIRKQAPPHGWSVADMEVIASVARYHRGGLAKLQERNEGAAPTGKQEGVLFLAGVLRLAVALAARDMPKDQSSVSAVKVDASEVAIIVHAVGFHGQEPFASRLAEARHLLESILHQPIVIQPGRSSDSPLAAA